MLLLLLGLDYVRGPERIKASEREGIKEGPKRWIYS